MTKGPTGDRKGPSRLQVLACLLAVILLAGLNLLRNLDEPHGAVWDESYYIASTARYLQGRAQFASHPPLGLMLIAAGEKLTGGNEGIVAAGLGAKKYVEGRDIPAGYDFTGVRMASALFGVCAALIFFLLMCQLTGRAVPALLFSSLFIFDTALIAQFRAAHLDAFQIFFSLCALLCLARAAERRDRGNEALNLGFGLFCGLAAMVRLNALVLLPLGAMLGLARFALAQGEPIPRRVFRLFADGLAMAAGCVIAILLTFTAHMAVSQGMPDVRTEAGAKDAAFLSPVYRAWLRQERSFSPEVLAAGMADYDRYIQSDFEHMAKTDPNGSQPLQWLGAPRPITYRWDSDGRTTSYVVLAPNAVIWWIGLAAVAASALLLGRALLNRREGNGHRRLLMAILLAGWVLFMAVNIWLARERVMYLYHYFIGLMLALTLAPLAISEALDNWPRFERQWTKLSGAAAVAILAAFLFLAPLALHKPLDAEACRLRNLAGVTVKCRG